MLPCRLRESPSWSLRSCCAAAGTVVPNSKTSIDVPITAPDFMTKHPRDIPNLVDSLTNIPDYGRPDPYRRSHFVHNAAAIVTSVWAVTDDAPEGLPGLLTKAGDYTHTQS